MRARIYARYSTDMQDYASIADQLRVGKERITREQWEFTGQYIDEGVSGSALGNRPGVLQAIRDGEAGRYDILLIMELGRLARSEDLPKLIQRLRFRGIRVIGLQDGFDSLARTARMQAGMAGIMGAEFIEMISRRVHSALEMRAKEGRPTGGKAFDNPEIVREIFARFAAGESMKAIASDLNRRKIPSPGATWKSAVGHVVCGRFRLYTPYYAMNGTSDARSGTVRSGSKTPTRVSASAASVLGANGLSKNAVDLSMMKRGRRCRLGSVCTEAAAASQSSFFPASWNAQCAARG